MITSSIYRHKGVTSLIDISTKKIRIDASLELYFQITSEGSGARELLENAIVEVCSEGKKPSETDEVFFSRLLSSLNRFLAQKEMIFASAKIRIFLGLLRGDTLSFSLCGPSTVYLQQGDAIMDIADGMSTTNKEFSYVSTGTVGLGDVLYVANTDLLAFLTKEDLHDLAGTHDTDLIESLLSREAKGESVECLVFRNMKEYDFQDTTSGTFRSRNENPFVAMAIDYAKKGYSSTKTYYKSLNIEQKAKMFLEREDVRAFLSKKEVRAGFFLSGIIVAVAFLYIITSSIFQANVSSSVPETYKSKLIEAQTILNRSGKDIANKDVFKDNLKKAESLIFEVRNENLFRNDVESLLAQLSTLKRQFNGIETYTLANHQEIFSFANDKDFSPIGIFENSKKLYFVWKEGIYGPFVQGNEVKKATYPDGEEAVSADMSSDGIVYVLTKSNRVIKYAKGEFSYVNVEGQTAWQASNRLRTFIGNLYLLSQDGNQIFKHRPNVNGFTGKSPILEASAQKNLSILDFTIDGGIYLLKNDLTFDRLLTTPTVSRSSLMINKLPDNYSIDDGKTPRLIVSPTANYLYMVLSNHIWIFEPDSRNAKDVRSISYVGQIELEGRKLESITVPKDGEIIAITDQGVSEIRFEISDGKIHLR